jgi:hypothetical protein
MSELQLIHSALNKAAGRRRWAGALRGLWYGLLAGAIISLLLIGAYHLRPLPMYLLLVAAAVPFPCMLIGLIIGGWRKPGMSEVARWVDVKQHLQERLSTALEVSAEEKTGKWQELVVTDAAAHAQEIDPKRLVPFNLPQSVVALRINLITVSEILVRSRCVWVLRIINLGNAVVAITVQGGSFPVFICDAL